MSQTGLLYRRRSHRRRFTALTQSALLGLFTVSGCGDPVTASLLAGPLLPFAGLAAYAEMQKAIDNANERLPDLDVEIVNETDQQAALFLNSGIVAPDSGVLQVFVSAFGGMPTFVPLSYSNDPLVVNPHGTATGRIKCGDILGISAISPPDAVAMPTFPSSGYEGFYQTAGNVEFTGIGVASENSDQFTGDLAQPMTGVRFVRPAEDGVVCGASTLVIRIQTPSITNVNPGNGSLFAMETPGSGTLSLR